MDGAVRLKGQAKSMATRLKDEGFCLHPPIMENQMEKKMENEMETNGKENGNYYNGVI